MTMTSARARKLADILLGLQDTKEELLAAYEKTMQADVIPNELLEAAERWETLSDELEAWYEH